MTHEEAIKTLVDLDKFRQALLARLNPHDSI
jgi:hypothetical protein